jgi:hypothetical protein
MHRGGLAATWRRLLPWLVVAIFGVVALAERPAWADPATEAAAKALQKKAVEEDFLNMDYPSAIAKLKSAVAKCDGDKCSSTVKGSVFRDLGAMQILGGDEGSGRASFGQAIALDSSLELDPSYKNAQLDTIWNDVKKKGPPAGGGTAPPAGPPPAGDFAHTPPTEELVRTPLPVYAEYTGGETLARVIVKYKAPGMTDWKPLDLKKAGDTGWGGLIPCKDVAQGAMTYYIQGFNAANDPVATSGSRNKPFTVPVKTQIAGEPPALPGQDPPKQCGEMVGAECPPDFPGCATKKGTGEDCDKNDQCKSNACVGGKCAEKKAGGEECEKDDECTSNSCSDGKCAEAKKADGEDCESGDECEGGTCKEGKCGGGGSKYPKIWVGISGSLDLYLMPGAQDACLLNAAGTGPLTAGNPYTCLASSTTTLSSGATGQIGYSSGTPFPTGASPSTNPAGCTPGSAGCTQAGQAVNNAIAKGRSDQVQGGFAPGPVAIMVSFDYALNMNMLVGARAGYELLTIPTGPAFAPFHGEGRFTYLFGKNAITSSLAPMVFGGVGVGEFDAYVPVNIFLSQAFNNATPTVNAWITAGPLFLTEGGGVRMAFGSKHNIAATGALKLQEAFGGTAGFLFGFVPEIGAQYGF